MAMTQVDVLGTLKEVFGHDGFRTREQEEVVRRVLGKYAGTVVSVLAIS